MKPVLLGFRKRTFSTFNCLWLFCFHNMKRRKEVRRRKEGTEKRRVERGRGRGDQGKKKEIPNSYPSFYSSTSK